MSFSTSSYSYASNVRINDGSDQVQLTFAQQLYASAMKDTTSTEERPKSSSPKPTSTPHHDPDADVKDKPTYKRSSPPVLTLKPKRTSTSSGLSPYGCIREDEEDQGCWSPTALYNGRIAGGQPRHRPQTARSAPGTFGVSHHTTSASRPSQLHRMHSYPGPQPDHRISTAHTRGHRASTYAGSPASPLDRYETPSFHSVATPPKMSASSSSYSSPVSTLSVNTVAVPVMTTPQVTSPTVGNMYTSAAPIPSPGVAAHMPTTSPPVQNNAPQYNVTIPPPQQTAYPAPSTYVTQTPAAPPTSPTTYVAAQQPVQNQQAASMNNGANTINPALATAGKAFGKAVGTAVGKVLLRGALGAVGDVIGNAFDNSDITGAVGNVFSDSGVTDAISGTFSGQDASGVVTDTVTAAFGNAFSDGDASSGLFNGVDPTAGMFSSGDPTAGMFGGGDSSGGFADVMNQITNGVANMSTGGDASGGSAPADVPLGSQGPASSYQTYFQNTAQQQQSNQQSFLQSIQQAAEQTHQAMQQYQQALQQQQQQSQAQPQQTTQYHQPPPPQNQYQPPPSQNQYHQSPQQHVYGQHQPNKYQSTPYQHNVHAHQPTVNSQSFGQVQHSTYASQHQACTNPQATHVHYTTPQVHLQNASHHNTPLRPVR